MPGRAKLTTQALEEYIPGSPSRERASPAPETSPVKKPKPLLAPSSKKRTASVVAAASRAKKPKPSREKLYACAHPGCGKSFVRPCRLEEHLRSHTGERPYKCTADRENCDKSFLRESHLKAHVKALHLKERKMICTFMIAPGNENDRGEFGFKRKVSEISSTPRKENGTHEECEEVEEELSRKCGARFCTGQQLKRHIESHMKTLPYVCTEYLPCSAGFRKRGPLRRHIRSAHLNILPWACQLQDMDSPDKPCTAAFDTKGKLGGHIDTVHKRMMPALYTCAMCMVSANDQKGTKVVPKKCSPGDLEGRELESSAESTGHDDSHHTSDLSPAQYPESGASTPFPIIRSVLVPDLIDWMIQDPDAARLQGKMGFKTFRELRKHTIELHPPTCKHCCYTCKNSRNLRIHIKNSHGASVNERRIFPCETCDATFTKKHALKIHTNTVHEHLRPFVCIHAPCTKTYGYKAQLTRHTENHHSGRKPRSKSSRKKFKTAPGLIAQLTGVGYEESGRNIKCIVEECPYRFFRIYDLKSHLGSMKHGFTDSQLDELMIEAEAVAGGECGETDDGGEEEETDEDGSSGSDSDEDEYDVGMRHADLWDSMSDMEIVSDMDIDKDNE